MAIKQLNPYLMFNGDAAKAIALYESALGAKVQTVMRYGDVPGNAPKPENKDRVMHSALNIDSCVLMMSDVPADVSLTPGRNYHVCLDFDERPTCSTSSTRSPRAARWRLP